MTVRASDDGGSNRRPRLMQHFGMMQISRDMAEASELVALGFHEAVATVPVEIEESQRLC